MIVFLTANKISSFGVEDKEEEEKHGGVWGGEKEEILRTEVHCEKRWTDRAVSVLTEREKDGEAAVIVLCRRSSKRDPIYFFCCDTGADGQFNPVSALAVLPRERSAGSLSDSHGIAAGSTRPIADYEEVSASSRRRPSTLTSATLVDGKW